MAQAAFKGNEIELTAVRAEIEVGFVIDAPVVFFFNTCVMHLWTFGWSCSFFLILVKSVAYLSPFTLRFSSGVFGTSAGTQSQWAHGLEIAGCRDSSRAHGAAMVSRAPCAGKG